MIYRFLILSDEIDHFSREIEINSDASFLDFNNAILDSVKFTKDQITSFFICNDAWEKLEEITLVEMDTNSETDSYLMESTPIEEFIKEEGQRLIYVFDYLTDRAFFIELKEIHGGHLKSPKCISSKGNAPVQITEEDAFLNSPQVGKEVIDAEFYGDSEFDENEIDEEGFGDYSIDELNERF